MSDTIGLLDLPAPVPVVDPPAERTLAPGDPALVQLASFAATVLQADVGAAWTPLGFDKPEQPLAIDGERHGKGPVRHSWFHDPRRGYFDPSDLPGVFVYRGAQSTAQWMLADAQRQRSQVVIAWVMPPTQTNFQRHDRDPFVHAVRSSLHMALTLRRHPAWVISGDQTQTAALKSSFATSTSPVTITTFDGPLASTALRTARPITITTAPAIGAYNTTDPIQLTGLLGNTIEHTESVFLTDPDGGETIKTIFPFVCPLSAALPAMLTTGGAIEIGYADAPDVRKGSLIQRACNFREMWYRRAQTVTFQVDMPGGNREPFDGIEFFLDVAEDGEPNPVPRAYSPWDIEAHGTFSLPGEDIFEIVIQD